MPHDLRAIALFNLGDRAGALEEAEKALAAEPDNERLQNNVRFLRGG